MTIDERVSQLGPPTIVSHDDSTIDEKVFEWDNEIVNAEIYRRAMNHARMKTHMASKHADREDRHDASSQAETEESGDRLSPMDSPSIIHSQKPQPYEMSIVSEPVYVEQDRVVVPNSSVSDKSSYRRSILSYRQKKPDADRRSLWSTISGKRSSRSLAPPGRNATPESVVSRTSTPGSRRGRRGFESSYHTSIDFGSEDGLSAPPIVRAAQAGSVVEVEKLLDQRADINARHLQSGRSALLVASHCGNEEVVRLLLRYGATVNDRDASSLSALHLASLRGHVAVVESLLQEHADIDVKGPNDRTPLRIASEKGQVEVAEVLLRKQAKVNARDESQMTPLHAAAKHGDASMTVILVSHGAHIEAKDSNFMGALHYACEGGFNDVVSILLTHKADIEAPGKASMTPLICAASAGKANVAELLLKKKASIKYKGEGDMTALHWASFNGHAEVADILLLKKALINATNKDGRTPLHLAVMAGNFAVADLLLREGASVEAPCKAGRKPLHYACMRANPEISQLLLGYNANVEAVDSSQTRPLHNASARGSLPHVELLIQKGVNIDARNMTGDRPLCLASSMGHVDVVRMLLHRGAAVRSKFASGPSHEDSPLCLAAKGGHIPVIEELLRRGASVLQKDERDWQPLRYAAYYAHPTAVELLLRHGATVSGSASGGWGFDLTAQRIGFANDLAIEEQRKGQVMRLLTSAEALERKTQEYAASAARPVVPPAVQNQTVPAEIDSDRSPAPPAQSLTSAPSPQASSGTNAEPRQSANTSPSNLEMFAHYFTPPQANFAPTTPVLPPHQAQTTLHQGALLDSQQISPQPQVQAYPTPGPATPSAYPIGYPIISPNPSQTYVTSQNQNRNQPATSYTFVPKTVPTNAPSIPYHFGAQYQPRASGYGPAMTNAAAPTMTLGPDGLWRQVSTQNTGVQQAPSQNGAPPSTPAPVNYPQGVFEMAS